MQIILVPDRSGGARTLLLKPGHIVAGFFALVCLVLAGSLLLSWLSLRWQLPLATLFQHDGATAVKTKRADTVSIDDPKLRALAERLGELQAKMVRLDSLSQRLSEQANISITPDPSGGPYVPAPLSEYNLNSEIERLASQIDEHSLTLNVVNRSMRARNVRQFLLPTSLPLTENARLGSPFGVRVDPFGRGRAMHEGLDFVAPYGSPVLAAADGIVVFAAFHPEFGKLVEINHGGELITRYAHLSDFSVRAGQPVRRGQAVGKIGSTGRSTGAHLHFEVRQNGLALDPAKFLANYLAPQKKQADSREASMPPEGLAAR